VGFLGVLLPVILPIGVVLLSSGTGLQDSISDYYDTVMRGVFVGVLFAIGVFLFSYVGYEPSPDKKTYEPSDNTAGNLACVFALGVALFPTTSDSNVVRTTHFLSAAALFLTLSYFSLYLFTKTKVGATPTPKKETRNKVYVVCGVFMLACIALIAVYNWLFQDTSIAVIKPVFWLESLALWAFGWSWFVKGEGLAPLNDAE
jgi:hypothetical protein